MPLLRTHIVPHPPLIVPAVGKGGEKQIQSTVDAYHQVAKSVAADKPDLIIFITPHGKLYDDYLHIAPGSSAVGDFGRFGVPRPSFSLQYDDSFITHLSVIIENTGIPAGTLGGQDARAIDHGVLVPLYFINQYHTVYKAVRISISGLPFETHYRLGQCLQHAINATNRRTVIIASGDLSHRLTEDGPYGYAPEGPTFDTQVCDAMRRCDFLQFMAFDHEFCDNAAECGLRSFIIMAGALDQRAVTSDFLSYEGPFGVGYAVCSFTPGEKCEERAILTAHTQAQEARMAKHRANEDAYVKLARETVENFVKTGRVITGAQSLPQEMLTQQAGTFVSIKKEGRLRGCIGTTESYHAHIAEEIIGNAISAATRDPRFDAITPEELPYLTYSVDILAPAETIDTPDALDVRRYGVIVTSGSKRGLLLPNLDGVDTVAEQIAIASQKAGIKPGEPVTLQRFEVVRHT